MPQPTFSTINQFADKQPAFSAGGLRALIFNERSNGLSKSGAIVRIGRKVLSMRKNSLLGLKAVLYEW